LADAGPPWRELTGPPADRLDAATAAVDELPAAGWGLPDPI